MMYATRAITESALIQIIFGQVHGSSIIEIRPTKVRIGIHRRHIAHAGMITRSMDLASDAQVTKAGGNAASATRFDSEWRLDGRRRWRYRHQDRNLAIEFGIGSTVSDTAVHRHCCIVVGRWKLENWRLYRYTEHRDAKTKGAKAIWWMWDRVF